MELSAQAHALVALSPEQESLVSIEQEAVWDPEPVWMFWRIKEFLVPAGI